MCRSHNACLRSALRPSFSPAKSSGGGYRGLLVLVVIHAYTRKGNVWTFEGSSRRLPTDTNGNFFGAPVFRS